MLKIRCTEVQRAKLWNTANQQKHHKAKFHSPYTYLMKKETMSGTILSIKYQDDLVVQTKSNTASVSDSVFSEGKEENADIAEGVEGTPAEVPAPAPATAPAHWNCTVDWNNHTLQDQESQHVRTSGRPASAYSDFYM